MVAVNTNVFVAPTAGQNVAYQLQINGLIAGGSLRPALILGSLLFDGSVGTPDARLKNVTLYEVPSHAGLLASDIAFLKAALPAVYPDVTAALQVLPSGEITLEGTALGGYNEWMSAMVLTVGPEVILPAVTPTFDPFSLVPGVPTAGPVLKVVTIDVPPLSTVTVCPAPDPGFVRVTGNSYTGPGLGVFISSYPIGASASFILSLIDPVFLGVPLLADNADVINPGTLHGVLQQRIVFGPGETLDLQNLDAVNTIRVTTGYIDVPNTGIGLIRVATTGTTPVTIVPAPTDPSKLRVPFWPESFPNSIATNKYAMSPAYWVQRDTVVHTGRTKQFGEVYTSSDPIPAAPAELAVLLLLPVVPFTGAITFEFTEATVTDEGLIIGAYQDVDA
jgi:hypothetical protein